MHSVILFSTQSFLAEALTDSLPECKLKVAASAEALPALLPEAQLLIVERSEAEKQPGITADIASVIFSRPVKLRELLYTIRTRLQAQSQETISLQEGFSYASRERVLTSNQSKANVSLTEKEDALFTILLNNQEKSYSREELLAAVWGYHEEADSHTLETHIYRLRNKLKQVECPYDILSPGEGGYKITLQTS